MILKTKGRPLYDNTAAFMLLAALHLRLFEATKGAAEMAIRAIGGALRLQWSVCDMFRRGGDTLPSETGPHEIGAGSDEECVHFF